MSDTLVLHQTMIPEKKTSNWEETNTVEFPNEKDKSSYLEKRNDKVWKH